MIITLHIENIAVIEKAEVEFSGGMTVLTGETGAGKSVVIDALGAVIGGRTSRELVRTGASGALVSGVFLSEAGKKWCEDNGFSSEEDEIFVSRRITAEGKNNCRINGIPASVGQLRELGSLLVDIHGQNDGQRLLDEKTHRAYLDGYAGNQTILEEYRKKYEEVRTLLREKNELTVDESERERRVDTLQFQIRELENANLSVGELEDITARSSKMKNAEKLSGAIREASALLNGGERSDGVVSMIGSAGYAVNSASRYDPELQTLASRLSELQMNAQDILETLFDFERTLDFSEEEYEELEARLSTLKRLLRKYGGDEESALAFLENCRRELESISSSADRLLLIDAELEKKRAEAFLLAKKVTESRKEAASLLEKRLVEELRQLSMNGVRFQVSVTPTDDLTSFGCDEVSFLMSANPGEEPGKISRIASGGELSRIMLAMKNVIAESDVVDTMIFDEIDTGVSGIAAQRVGEKMAKLAFGKQVLCVTHLPQIAAISDHHLLIRKDSDGERTYTSLTVLDREGRKGEIARLTGGDNVTSASLLAAEEQIRASELYKEKIRS